MTDFDLGPVRGLRPDERDDAPVVGLTQMFGSAVEESHKASNFDAHLFNYSNAFDSIADRVKAATGEALDNPFRSASFGQSVEMLTNFSREAVEGSTLYAQWQQRAQELKAKHPDKMDWDALLEEPGRVAWESMKKAREEADSLSERVGMVAPRDVPLVGSIPGVNAAAALAANLVRHPQYTAAQLAGGFLGQMRSPADAAMNFIPFGAGRLAGGAAKSIVKNATANALTNLAGQSLLSAPKQLSYRDAGLPYGWQVWADEVGAAAGAGFMLDAAIRTPARAALRRFGRDTAPGTAFSRNTERGGILFDAITDATPAPRPRLDIDPETIRKANDGDVTASREILEKTGAMEDPAVKYAVDHLEAGGRLTEEALTLLEKQMGVARPDGMRALADAMQGRFTDSLPDPIRQAAEPLEPARGSQALDRVEQVAGVMESLPGRMREAVEDGLQAGVPRIVQAVEKALDGAQDGLAGRIAETVLPLLDDRTLAEVRIQGGRAGPIEIARAIRQFPDIIDDTVDLESSPVAMGRSIARLDPAALDDVLRGDVPAEVAAMVSDSIPREQQARVLADLQKAQPKSLAEAADLIEAIAPPRHVPGSEGQLAAGSKIDDPAGPAAKAQTETLRQEAGQAYADAMEPIQRRDAIEDELKKLRGQLIKGKTEEAPAKPEGGEGEASGPGAIHKQIEALEREHAVLQAQIMPGPEGYELARLAMRAIDLRREADIMAAVNDALRMLPDGTRVEVRGPDDIVFRAANGERADAATDMDTGHIQLAVTALDPAAKIGHEAVHTLVTLGHLSPTEVDGLASLARDAGTFKLEDRYREVYAGRDNLERIIPEEAAGSYIEARIRGDVKGPENTIVERIRQLLERIRSALAGQGFQSREDVVQAIMSGEAARREARADWRRDAVQRMRAEDITAAAASPDGKLFAFAGERAKTADLDALGAAKWMETTGEDRTRIWTETGWFRGVDGKWRFEIDDSQAIWRGMRGASRQYAREYMQHPSLYDAYPGSGAISVSEREGMVSGYNPKLDVIGIAQSREKRSVFLHEMQHALQKREDFAEGGNLHLARQTPEYAEAIARLESAPPDNGWTSIDVHTPDTIADGIYRRFAGEAEARLVEKRSNLTPEERAKRPPWLDYDVPESEQIVRSGEQLFSLADEERRIPSLLNRLEAVGGETAMPPATQDLGFTVSGEPKTPGRAEARAKADAIRETFTLEARRFLDSHPPQRLAAMIDMLDEYGSASERAAAAELKSRMDDVKAYIAASRELETALSAGDAADRAARLAKAAAEPRPIDQASHVYHGTTESFDQYSGDVARSRSAAAQDAGIDVVWVTPQKTFAERFGEPRRLTLEPGYYFDPLDDRDLARLAPFINARSDAQRWWSALDNTDGKSTWGFLESAETLHELQRLGYDGVRMQEQWVDAGDRTKVAPTIAVFTRGKVFDRDRANAMFALRDWLPRSQDRRPLGAYRDADVLTSDDLPGRFAWKSPPKEGRVQMFHATNRDFDRFDPTKSQDFGIHFGTQKQAWNRVFQTDRIEGSRVIPANVEFQNAITLTDPGFWGPLEMMRLLREKGVTFSREEAAYFEQMATDIDRAVESGPAAKGALRWIINEAKDAIKDKLNESGIDAIWYRNTAEGTGWSLMVWNEGQVRNTITGDLLYSMADDPPVKSDMAFVDRMNRMGELIAVCRG